MKIELTAVFQKVPEGYIGFVEELPGADLSHETLSVEVTPRQADEFTCTGCFLVQHESRRSAPAADLCRDCA